jgi:SAM-dependent methyltransferase
MKLRESGMPDEGYWESLMNIELILDRLEVDKRIGNAVELGCGYGTFTLPVAGRISGTLRTYDIDPDMVSRTRERAERSGVRNLIVEARDVFTYGFGVQDHSQDACLLFNILHCEHPLRLLREASRTLKPGGYLFALHWRPDPSTPRGPAMDIRPSPYQIIEWVNSMDAFETNVSVIDLPPWHYGLRFPHNASE